MGWLTVIGLGLDAVGALIVLAPRLKFLMRPMEKVWWLKDLETAKAQLYREGKITRETPGFNHIATAIDYGSDWTTQPGERLEHDGSNEVRVEINGEVRHFEGEGYDLFEIERIDDEDAYPLESHIDRPPVTQSMYTLKYRPRSVDESGIPALRESSPYLAAESPPGQLPDQINQHKERLVFRLGSGLLFLGFSLQLIPALAAQL